jgi:hypothetical protein
VTVGSAQLVVGSGEHHVIALHGWFGSARGWGPLLATVMEEFLRRG